MRDENNLGEIRQRRIGAKVVKITHHAVGMRFVRRNYIPHPFFASFDQASFKVMVRLKTSLPADDPGWKLVSKAK